MDTVIPGIRAIENDMVALLGTLRFCWRQRNIWHRRVNLTAACT